MVTQEQKQQQQSEMQTEEQTKQTEEKAAGATQPVVSAVAKPFLEEEEASGAGVVWKGLPFAAMFLGAAALMWWRMAPPHRPTQRFHPLPTHDTRT